MNRPFTIQLKYPFRKMGLLSLRYMVLGSWWECNSGGGCGMCDACSIAEDWEKFKEESPELHAAVWGLQNAWEKCHRLALSEDAKRTGSVQASSGNVDKIEPNPYVLCPKCQDSHHEDAPHACAKS